MTSHKDEIRRTVQKVKDHRDEKLRWATDAVQQNW